LASGAEPAGDGTRPAREQAAAFICRAPTRAELRDEAPGGEILSLAATRDGAFRVGGIPGGHHGGGPDGFHGGFRR
jgi:hypothetical protein